MMPLFIDTVGYCKLLIDDQRELINALKPACQRQAKFIWESRLPILVVTTEREAQA